MMMVLDEKSGDIQSKNSSVRATNVLSNFKENESLLKVLGVVTQQSTNTSSLFL